MNILMKAAWRNIFRHKRRTVITGTAIAIGLAAMIFIDAMVIGMERNMVRAATASFPGQGQIHAAGFRETQEVERTVRDGLGVLAELDRDPRVRTAAPRTASFAMIASASNSASVMLYGVEPEREARVSQIDDVLARGRFFGAGGGEIVIGSKLAEILDVAPGDRIVVTAAQAGSGELSQDLFRVAGIYKFGMNEFDGGLAFIRLNEAQRMLGLPGTFHEIALSFRDPALSGLEGDPFWGRYGAGGNEAVGWKTLFPQLKMAYDLSGSLSAIAGVILFAMISLSIINTLFMSIYERMFEFGVLRALGTRPRGVRGLVVYEAGALAVLSIVLGTALGFGLTFLMSRLGIDYRGAEYFGVTLKELIYPVLKPLQFVIYPAAVFVFTLLIGFYPARTAARMSVAGALKKIL